MAFEQLKERQAQMWGNGNFEKISETGTAAYDDLVGSLAPSAGERWLDVACGTGAVAFRAARAGADVTGIDFAPALVETAKRIADEEELDVALQVGDAENLPFEDGSFDVVSSSFGVMFCPDERRSADELARVAKSGGRLGLLTWVPESGVGRLFATLLPFQPPPPDGVARPLDWGREEHVRVLLGDAFELDFHEGDMPLEAESGEEVWELFSTSFGPVKTLWEMLESPRREELRQAFIDFHEGFRQDGGIDMERKYLVTVGTRR
jgi:ubiquinone/menaquinone biosynthesis C-methylase UbiE